MFLSELAAVAIFPSSATALALRQLRTALTTLAQLNRSVWEHSEATEQKPDQAADAVQKPSETIDDK